MGRSRKMFVGVASLALVACMASSCSKTATGHALVVTFPPALQTSSQDYKLDGDHLAITVRFSRSVDEGSVVVGKTFVVVTDKDPNATGALTWAPDQREVTFKSDKARGDLLNFTPDGHFTLKILGTDAGNGVVKAQDGTILDGDNNGTGGGDYKTSFTLVG